MGVISGRWMVVSAASPHTLGSGRTGLQILELLFDVDDILDDVSAAVVGALDLVSQLVAFGFGLVDARLEFIV